MKYRELDERGDYTFGRNRFLHDIEAVGQAVMTRMKLLYSEWWENTEDGLPLFQRTLGTFGAPQNLAAVDLIISRRITGTVGVSNLTRFESRFENRIYTAECTINTVYGSIELSILNNAREVEVTY